MAGHPIQPNIWGQKLKRESATQHGNKTILITKQFDSNPGKKGLDAALSPATKRKTEKKQGRKGCSPLHQIRRGETNHLNESKRQNDKAGDQVHMQRRLRNEGAAGGKKRSRTETGGILKLAIT